MRVHHLDCGTLCPLGGRLIDGRTRGLGPAHLVCHCLLIESDWGLVLVDTGLGMNDVRFPQRLSGAMRRLLNVRLDPEKTAVRQLAQMGFSAEDVRHIVLTHLDFDHAGGLQDFPRAEVHVLEEELVAANHPRTPIDRGRYRHAQWRDVAVWHRYRPGAGEPWFGFAAVRGLEGLPPEILLVPLPGHTFGHAGIAVDIGHARWLLHAGDAYFFIGEMANKPYVTPGLAAYQRLMEVDRRRRIVNRERLRALVATQSDRVEVFSAHDPTEFEQLVLARPRPIYPQATVVPPA